jgi:hypothetical protein
VDSDPCGDVGTWLLALGSVVSLTSVVLLYRAAALLAAARRRFNAAAVAPPAASPTRPGRTSALGAEGRAESEGRVGRTRAP